MHITRDIRLKKVGVTGHGLLIKTSHPGDLSAQQ